MSNLVRRRIAAEPELAEKIFAEQNREEIARRAERADDLPSFERALHIAFHKDPKFASARAKAEALAKKIFEGLIEERVADVATPGGHPLDRNSAYPFAAGTDLSGLCCTDGSCMLCAGKRQPKHSLEDLLCELGISPLHDVLDGMQGRVQTPKLGSLDGGVGLNCERLLPGATALLYADAQLPFRPRVLVFEQGLAERVEICSLRLGKTFIAQLSANPIPGLAAAFFDFGQQECSVGNRISLTVKNTSDKALDFRSAVLGKIIQDPIHEPSPGRHDIVGLHPIGHRYGRYSNVGGDPGVVGYGPVDPNTPLNANDFLDREKRNIQAAQRSRQPT